MGNGEGGGGDVEVVVEEDVDVDDAVVVGGKTPPTPLLRGENCFLGASQQAFNQLGLAEKCQGRQRGFDAYGGIEEGVGALESPRLGFKEGGLSLDRPNPPCDFGDGRPEILFLVAKIRSE